MYSPLPGFSTHPHSSQADDFVQETFLRLWLARSRYEPTGKFSTYLFQIGKHYWLNQRKKLRPEVGIVEESGSTRRIVPDVAVVRRPQPVISAESVAS